MERVGSYSRVFVAGIADASGQDLEFDDLSRGISWEIAREESARVLEYLRSRGAQLLLVEDELARATDRNLPSGVGVVDENVIGWCSVDERGIRTVERIRQLSSGYPTNAYILDRPAGDIGIVDGLAVPIAPVVDSTIALVVSVYDGESLLFLY